MQFQNWILQNEISFLYFSLRLIFWMINLVLAAETIPQADIDQQNKEYYDTALFLLRQISSNYYTDLQLDDYILLKYEGMDNVQINIPPDYNQKPHTLCSDLKIDDIDHIEPIKNLLANLTIAADQGDAKSSYLLAQLYTFGNYTIPKSPKLALHYYKWTALLEDNGDANFMAGFIYTTGLFSDELTIDHARANLFFKIAADLDHPKALMTLGFRYYEGIHVKKDVELALYYYSRLSKILFDALSPNREIGCFHSESFDIRLHDLSSKHEFLNSASTDRSMNLATNLKKFGNNMNNAYGAFENTNSLMRNIEDYVDNAFLSDVSLDEIEISYAKKYYQTLAAYEGDYIFRRNYTKAFQLARECAITGTNSRKQYFKYTGEGVKISTKELSKYLDLYFINECVSLLGHFYLRGDGVEQDFNQAFDWIIRSESIGYDAAQLNDLGLIYEFGLVSSLGQNLTQAALYYNASGSKGSSDGYYNFARLSLKVSIPTLSLENYDSSTTVKSDIFLNSLESIMKIFKRARNMGSLEACYELARLLELLDNISKYDVVSNYKRFVELMEHKVSNLQWSMKCVLIEDWQNALLGYAMAAEQGYERSQISTAFLLYRNPTILQKLTGESSFDSLPKLRYSAAADYLLKASKQKNIDALVLLGDLYYYDLIDNDYAAKNSDMSTKANEVNTIISGPDRPLLENKHYKSAFIYYYFAAKEQSAQACWNIGYMYEYGIGISRDPFLAKRYYELALKDHPMVYFPVLVSLIRLLFKNLFFESIDWKAFF